MAEASMDKEGPSGGDGTPPFNSLSLSIEDQEDSTHIDCANELALASFPSFNELRRARKLCDIAIECSGAVLWAHRVVLAATIPFFHVMLTTEMREAQAESIHLPNIDAETMTAILDFVYTGRITICSENLEKLLQAADFLQLAIISEKCAETLSLRISPTNVLGIRKFAALHNSCHAAAVADRYIRRHFVAISATEEFVALDFELLLHLLQADELHVDSEEQVFEAAIRWLEADLSARNSLAPRLLNAVRMPLLKPSFLARLSNNHIIHNSIECRDLLDEAKNYHLLPERRALFNSFKTKSRYCPDVPGLICVVGGLNYPNLRRPSHLHSSTSAAEVYDPLVGKWSLAKPMATLRTRLGVCSTERRVYVIGGYDGSERLQSVEVFDPTLNTWSFAPPLLQKRSAMGVAAIPGHIYVCGGYDGTSALATVESFDLGTQKWVMRQPMQTSRCAAAAAYLDGFIYVTGGHNGITIFNTVERCDPTTGRWEQVAPMHSARCRLSATTNAGKLYVAGGYNANVFLNTAEVYDPARDEWRELPPMQLKRARVQLVTNGPLIYALGGYDGENNLQSVETFDPAKNKWEFGTSMMAHEGGVGAAVVPNTAGDTADSPSSL